MSPFCHCLRMAAITENMSNLFSMGNFVDLSAISTGLGIQVSKHQTRELIETYAMSVRLVAAVMNHGGDKVRRAHGTTPTA